MTLQQIELEKISLMADQNPAKVPCDTELEAFDAQGQKHSFRPQFHVSADHFSLVPSLSRSPCSMAITMTG